MRLLFDQNVPKPLLKALPDHTVTRAAEMGWGELVNGDLIAAAESAGFDVLVTADKQWRYQQNLTNRKITIVVLPTNHWPELRGHLPEIAAAICLAGQGTYQELDLSRSPLVRRPSPFQSR